jgi:proteasome activator subunit 4
LQVRQKASKILGGLVHSKFLDCDAQTRLLQYFRSKIRSKMTRSKKNKFQKVQKTEDKVQLANFHAGILGLCAFVEAYPYDVPEFVPDILIELEKHLHDPQPIPKTIKNTFQVSISFKVK